MHMHKMNHLSYTYLIDVSDGDLMRLLPVLCNCLDIDNSLYSMSNNIQNTDILVKLNINLKSLYSKESTSI